MPVLIEEDLIEMGFGDLEGKLLKDYPEYQCIFSDPDRYVPWGTVRATPSWMSAAGSCWRRSSPPGGNYHDVVMCSHGAFIKGGGPPAAEPASLPTLDRSPPSPTAPARCWNVKTALSPWWNRAGSTARQ